MYNIIKLFKLNWFSNLIKLNGSERPKMNEILKKYDFYKNDFDI
jgi:hypothetical protein